MQWKDLNEQVYSIRINLGFHLFYALWKKQKEELHSLVKLLLQETFLRFDFLKEKGSFFYVSKDSYFSYLVPVKLLWELLFSCLNALSEIIVLFPVFKAHFSVFSQKANLSYGFSYNKLGEQDYRTHSNIY